MSQEQSEVSAIGKLTQSIGREMQSQENSQ
jgi:hypothetical protein